MKDCIANHCKINIHLFSVLLKAIGKPREPALLVLLDIYQGTKTARGNDNQNCDPRGDSHKLFDIYRNI